MSKRMGNALGAFLIWVFAAGCGDGTTEPEPVTDMPLTMQEAVALLEAVQGLWNDPEPQIISGAEGSAVIACPLGGQARLTGMGSDEVVADTGRLVLDLTVAPTGCQLSQDGITFTLDGNPGLRHRMEITIVGFFEAFTVEGSSTGTLDWQVADRSGTCEIDLALSGAPDLSGPEPTVSLTQTGRLCGHSVEVEVEPPPDL